MDKTTRKVVLKGPWWKRASEPLLGFEKETGNPVPLTPTLFGRFKNISEKRAKQLKEYAIASYELLPRKILSTLDLVRLGLSQKTKTVIQIALLSFLTIAFALVPLFALSWVFDHVFDEGDANLMWQITLLLSLVAFSSAFFLYLRNRALLRLDGIIANRIQPAIWHRLFELQVSIFRKISKSELISKISNFDEIREDLSGLTSQIFISSLFSSLYFIAMLIFSPLFTGIVLPFLALDIWLFVHFMRHKSKLKNHLEGVRGKRDTFLDQALSGLKKIRSEGLEKKIFSLWKKQFLEEEALENKLQNSRIRLEILNQSMPIVLFGIVMILFMAFPHSLGSIVGFYLALFNLSLAIREITQISFDFSKLLSKIKKVEKIMEEPLEKEHGKEVILKGEVIFQEVAFSQLSSLTFHIKQGEKVGIVGGSAATIVRLILGFENPLAGDIQLDGHPISELQPAHFRRQMGVVFRTDGLFAGNVYDNIDLGRGVSFEAIDQALKLSGFKHDLDQFPMGLHTLIPSGGDTLSGGQKQKLLLTRALAGSPSLLILDHALDCLDAVTLDEMMGNLKELPITQIYVGENEELLKKYCERMIVLEIHEEGC